MNPCKFCKSINTFVSSDYRDVFIICRHCRARGPVVIGDPCDGEERRLRTEAIRLWNCDGDYDAVKAVIGDPCDGEHK
jgi:hypothetical protein